MLAKPKLTPEALSAKKEKLISPDKKQCQKQIAIGAWPDAKHFMNLGPPSLRRCENKPVCIVKECKPAKDGRRGSMSLCGSCFVEFIEQFGGDYADVIWKSK